MSFVIDHIISTFMDPSRNKDLSGVIKKSLKFTFDKIAPLCICTFGAAIQVTTLITMYFEFPTSTIIEIYRPSIVTLPAISICYHYQLDIEKARSTVTRPLNSSLSSFDLRYELTVGEIDLMTPWLWDLVDFCQVALPKDQDEERNSYISCTNISQTVVNLNAYSKCFTFFGELELPFVYHRNDFYDEFFIRIAINWNVTWDKTIELYIHETKEELTYAHGSPWQISLDCSTDNLVVLTYLTTQSHGLGSPYSDCISYPDLRGRSRHDLIKNCMSNSIYLANKAFQDRSFIRMSRDVFNATFKKGISARKYRSECEEMYDDPECNTQLYEVQMLQSMNWLNIKNNQTYILFAYPLGFQSNVTTTQKLNFIEYFCYVASIISLWLEVSLLSVVNFLFVHFRKVVTKFFKHHKKKNEINRKLEKMRNEKLNRQKVFTISQKKRILRNQLNYPFHPMMYRDYNFKYF